MELEQMPIWADIRKVFKSGPKEIRYEYRGIIHTEKDDIKTMKVVTIDFRRDYVNNIGDHINIEFVIPLGDYVKLIYPYRENLEFTIEREHLMEGMEVVKQDKPLETRRYKAVFLTDQNPDVKGSEYDNVDKNTLNISSVINLKLQLLDRSLEPLRIKTLGGIYQKVNFKDLIHALVGGESLKVMVDGKPSIQAMDLVQPDNMEIHNHVIIPHGTMLTALPTFLQERMNGVYTAGIGTYLQYYKEKATWFVFPLYRPKRFMENVHKAIFYSVPRNRYTQIERTFRTDSSIIHILATDDKKYSDTAEADLMDTGVGFRQTDARPMMAKPIKMTPDGPVAVRRKLNHEVAIEERKDGLNFAPIIDRDISSNPFAQYSRIAAKAGGRIDLVWQNSDPNLIYPGMPCKYIYMDKDKTVEVEGVILHSHSIVQLDGEGMTTRSHTTTTQLTLFVERLKRDKQNLNQEA
jgi:hypothetical protein